MKKKYQKPEIQIASFGQRTYLLIGSPVPNLLVDDPNYDNWDPNGGQ
jgi:hypothetical protein